jgi:hypothetical protein
MVKKGKALEQLVGKIQEVIKDKEETSVEVGAYLTDTCGVSREFDVLVQTINQGIPSIIAFECKDYSTSKTKTKVDVKIIDAFIGKCSRIPSINQRIIVSTTGFTKSAVTTAEKQGVLLCHLSEKSSENINTKTSTALYKSITKVGAEWIYLLSSLQIYKSEKLRVWDTETHQEIDINAYIKEKIANSNFYKNRFPLFLQNGSNPLAIDICIDINCELYVEDTSNEQYPLIKIIIPTIVDYIKYNGKIEQQCQMEQGLIDIETTTFTFDYPEIKVKSIQANGKQDFFIEENETLKEPKFKTIL